MGATLISASSEGEVRLHAAGVSEMLSPLATLRASTGVPVHCLDVYYGDDGLPPRWAVASEHQQVQVWPLAARTERHQASKGFR